jgi:hypothetical protein
LLGSAREKSDGSRDFQEISMAIDSKPAAAQAKRWRPVAVLGGDLADFADDRLACMTRVLHERGPVAPRSGATARCATWATT